MKIKHLLIGMLAVAATVACQQDQPVDEAKLEVSTEAVALEATAAEATFEVTSNNDWTATADADWVTLDPASGAGAAEAVTVKVTAEDNEAAEARTATVTVKAGDLTKTVALTQAGTEPAPEPELPTPNVDWTSDAVVSYDLPEGASSKRQLLKNIKYTFDENYFYVKLQASAAEFAASQPEYLGIFVYDVTDGSGDGYYGWWNDAKGNVELEGEHIGTFNGKDITLTIGETPVEVVTEENGDELVWTMNILRSAHENLALENPHFAFLTYIGWEPNGALPDKYENMLQFTPAAEPEPEPEPVDVDIDGKQWVFTWEVMGGASCVIDLGVTEPGVAIIAYDMGVLDPSYAGVVYPYIVGAYTLTKTDGTSGVLTLSADGQEVSIPYSNATETSVHFAATALLEEEVDCTLAASKIEISMQSAEYLADGEYWIIADGKVATPLTSNYGYLLVTDAIDGKSYAANAFTFTQVETGLYTIQDANGKYYYQTGSFNSFNVSDKDGGTDEYLWEVYDSGNGQFVIMNYAMGKYVQYSTQHDSYGSYSDEQGVLPTLVLADNPVAEPEPEPEPAPTVSTIASVLALGANATIPADTFVEGVVISNMDLNNLTSKKGMYIQDETAGLQFYLAANHTFKFGDKVKVDLSGAKVAAYNGAVQISGLALEKIEVLSSGNTVEAKTVTIADFLANKYEGQYVAIEGVQVADADLSKTWGDPAGSSHKSINIEDANGNKFVVFSSKYASYKSETVAQGSGTIKGISSINNGNMQLIFAQTSDFAGLTGERFGQGAVEPEPEPEQPETPVASNRADFETFSDKYGQYDKEFTSAAGWHTVNCAIQEGGASDSNPVFTCIGKVPGTDQWAKAVCINGKVGASGVLTSPVIAGGCGTLSFTMTNVFTDKNGISFQIEVIQNSEVVKTLTVTKTASEVTQKVPIEHSVDVNVSGSFSLKFTNLSPSNSTSGNKDRVSLWNMTWTSFE